MVLEPVQTCCVLNECANVFKRTSGEAVVDARGPAALIVHFLKHLCLLEPRMKLEAVNPERILQVLARPGTKSFE